MKKSILFIGLFAFLAGSICAQQGKGKGQKKIVVENTLKAYFKAINSNDQAKWESMVDLTTLGWGTRDSLPWLMDPNVPSVKSPRDAASGMASGKKLNIAVEPTTWIRDSMFLKLRQNSFTFDDLESLTIRRGMSWGTKDSLPWVKAFILLKPGSKVNARVAGDEFRGVTVKDLKNKNVRDFYAHDYLGILRDDPKAINRMLSIRMQRKPNGTFVIVHADNPAIKLAPPPEKRGPGK